MEDAMILNKSSFERGFAHGTVIKCEVCSAITIAHRLQWNSDITLIYTGFIISGFFLHALYCTLPWLF